MSRAGLNQEQLVQMLADLPRFRYVRLAGLWSHLATAGDNLEFAYEQLARLEGVLAAHAGALDPDLLVHIAATHAACRDRRFHRGMVRVGLGLYGHGPDMLGAGPRLPLDRTLEPVLRWLARVIHVQSYRRGTPVGYGCTHHLRRDSVLGVVPVGYADGYPQALGNKGLVRVVESDRNSPVLAPVVGAVSMDQIVIDLTDAPGVRAGATVELVSNDPTSPLSLPKLAAAAGSTPYEVLCRLSPRLPREYVSIETVAAPAMPARLSVPGAV
jgi:alanine racemase